MKYYRLFLDDPAYAPLGFGTGVARWNRRMTPIIYAASQTSITINEILSIKGPTVAKLNWKLCTLNIVGPILELNLTDLPSDWNARPWLRSTQNIGTIWANEIASVGLKVPSARLNLSAYPEEHNLLINPLHPDFLKTVSVLDMEVFNFQLNDLS